MKVYEYKSVDSEANCIDVHIALVWAIHRPPWMENDDRIKTKTLINDQINGIHVDIRKYPAL